MKAPTKKIDTNVHLFHWPFRRFPNDDTSVLAAQLARAGVEQAWAGSFEGILCRDLAGVNARLAQECRRHGQGLFVPFGSVNPMLPDWEEDLRRCEIDHKMPGVRLHPNYHGYKLDRKEFADLLAIAEKRGMVVQLVVSMEDERTQHPLARVAPVDLGPLADLLKGMPKLRLVILNGLRVLQQDVVERVTAAGRVSFDIAMLEGVAGIERMIASVTQDALVFGSHAPLFYLESALLKLKESELTQQQLSAVEAENARGIVAK